MYKKAFLFICLSVACRAQVAFLGGCPSILTKQNFDATSYLGKWYETEKYFNIFEAGNKCITATYTSFSPGVINVYNQQLNVFNNFLTYLEGTATHVGGFNEGRFNIAFPWTVHNPSPYWIIDTDYTSYSIVYSCTSFFFYHFRFVWLLTRARLPTPEVVEKLHSVMDAYHIPRTFLTKTDQVNCPNNV